MGSRDFSELDVPLIQDVVLEQIKHRLSDGTFPPGAHLNLRQISEALGVSIVPVREAVKMLQSEGRLIRDRSRSYRVRQLTFDELTQMNQLSSYLELELITAGVPRLTADDIATMRRLDEDVAHRTGDRHAVLLAHRELHFVPFRAADKSVFLDSVRRLWDHYEHYRLLFFDTDPTIAADANMEHHEFVEACATGDVAGAVAIHRQHRTNSFAQLAQFADEAPQPSADG